MLSHYLSPSLSLSMITSLYPVSALNRSLDTSNDMLIADTNVNRELIKA